MSAGDLFGLIVAIGFRLSGLRALPGGAALMSTRASHRSLFYVGRAGRARATRSASTWRGSTTRKRGRCRSSGGSSGSSDAASERSRTGRATPRRCSSSASLFALLYAILRLQGHLSVNPDHMKASPVALALNTAASFITNTNWQYYGGETTMSYLSQMAGLAVQNFVSAAVGMAVLAAVVRGFAHRRRSTSATSGVDLFRSLLYVLLPLSIVVALVLISQGVLQTLGGHARRRRCRARTRRSPAAPSPRRSRSSSSAPTAAASSTQLVHAVREPERPHELPRVFAILLIPAALILMYGAHGGRPPPGLDGLRGDVR